MGTDHRGRRFCDGCGQLVAKIERIEGRDEYCGTCYKREFVVRRCSCGGSVRAHVSNHGPYTCRKCEAATRTCLRCAGPVPRAGLRVDGGVVCPSCRPYFREPQPCESCGLLSRRLSRRSDDPLGLLVCDRCRNKASHATCCHCGRSRAVAGRLSDDRPYCAPCGPQGGVTHPCPDCAGPVAGAGSGRCRPCLNRAALGREVSLHLGGLERSECRGWLPDFAAWMHARSPDSPILVRSFARHMAFVARIDSLLSGDQRVTGDWLLSRFSVSEMRRHLQFMRYLDETHGISLSEAAKQEAAEDERIRECLMRARRQAFKDVAEAYASHLTACELPVRTRRQYLSAAIAFCEQAKVVDQAWSAESTLKYLAKRPGQRANLGVFVTFCRQVMGWAVPDLPSPPAPKADSPSAKRLRQLMQNVESAGELASSAQRERVIELAFALPRGCLAMASVEQSNRGVVHLVINGARYRVPGALRKTVEAWASARKTAISAG